MASAARRSRSSSDALLKDGKRRRSDAPVVDHLGRNLRHVELLLDEFQALGVREVAPAPRRVTRDRPLAAVSEIVDANSRLDALIGWEYRESAAVGAVSEKRALVRRRDSL